MNFLFSLKKKQEMVSAITRDQDGRTNSNGTRRWLQIEII